MFGMTSSDTCITILLTVYGIYCGWAYYCKRRWPKPEKSEDKTSGEST
jgi:hypothetical protein